MRIARIITSVATSRLLKSDGHNSPEVKTLCQCPRVMPAGPQSKSLWGVMMSAGWLTEILNIKNMGYRMMRLTSARPRYKGIWYSRVLRMGFPFPFHDGEIREHKEEDEARKDRPAGRRKVVVLPGILVVRKGRDQRGGRGARQDEWQLEDAEGVDGPKDAGDGAVR